MKKLLSVLAIVLTLTFLLTGLSVLAEGEDNPLYRKGVLFVGDSICEACCEWGDATYGQTVGWAGRIIKNNKMLGINLGKSGASLSNCRGTNTVYAQLERQKSQTYDYIIMHGGVNDAWDSAPVGVVTEGFDGPFDLTTMAGGLENMICFVKKNFPDAQLGFIINFRLPTRKDIGKLADMSEYVAATIEICDKWEVPYLDLYNDDDFNDNVFKVKTWTNTKDGIHPNSAGYNLLAPVIEDWMKTLGVSAQPEESSEPEAVSEPEAATSEAVSEATPAPASTGGSGISTTLWIIIGAESLLILVWIVLIILGKKKTK